MRTKFLISCCHSSLQYCLSAHSRPINLHWLPVRNLRLLCSLSKSWPHSSLLTFMTLCSCSVLVLFLSYLILSYLFRPATSSNSIHEYRVCQRSFSHCSPKMCRNNPPTVTVLLLLYRFCALLTCRALSCSSLALGSVLGRLVVLLQDKKILRKLMSDPLVSCSFLKADLGT